MTWGKNLRTSCCTIQKNVSGDRTPLSITHKGTDKGIEREEQPGSYQAYVEKGKKRMMEAYDIAFKHASKSTNRGKKQYDKRIYGPELQVRNQVLVRNMIERGGPGKLRDLHHQRM